MTTFAYLSTFKLFYGDKEETLSFVPSDSLTGSPDFALFKFNRFYKLSVTNLHTFVFMCLTTTFIKKREHLS